ncbi:MAG: DoxX family membrane protein [Richelia sp. RM2_1_2]|nr:DoxX family membrane protein [Richelia sp. SM2_1_7]NJM20086.1 DoxX family membrane protein [Richelia sp. SM1_7_0]NJN08886.1 DoxX family membrane protein [Richelia sp. RM1_1_1]NJO31433.1 DoxX family membrane protein [Richelia sp. SL_2_1]NJO60756.1 DoxX family membrane protein [Richelia sp. RM2_1_2]NJS16718.1 DoxX family membrane protein [Nostocaceae cyanobacterium CSU_2_110]
MYNPKIQLLNSDIVLAYTFLRLVFGINMFVHGLVRIGNISGFVDSQVGLYKDIAIPPLLIAIPAYLIPIVEFAVGLLLILGLQTRKALIVNFLLMMTLMFGVCLLQKWDIAGSQLIYNLVLFILLVGCNFNLISVDNWLSRRQR